MLGESVRFNETMRLRLHPQKCSRNVRVPRQFVKEELPRIRWVNPKLTIELQKVRKTPAEKWRPEMEVELGAFRVYLFLLRLALTHRTVHPRDVSATQRTARCARST